MFTRTTAEEYRGDSRVASIDVSFAKMVKVLGEPHRTTDDFYPDDDHKTDVCWCVRSTENPENLIAFWNYKNGPNYNGGEGSVEDIDYFSVWYNNPIFWDEVRSLLARV